MLWEDEVLNWLKERGRYGKIAIAVVILVSLAWIIIYGSAMFLTSLDTINQHLSSGELSEKSLNSTHFVDNERPKRSGDYLILAHTPNPTDSLRLYMNGMLLSAGPNNDYTISDNIITILYPDTSSIDQFVAFYRY